MWILRKSIMVEIDTRTQSIIRMNFHNRDIDLRNHLALISPTLQSNTFLKTQGKGFLIIFTSSQTKPPTYLSNLLYYIVLLSSTSVPLCYMSKCMTSTLLSKTATSCAAARMMQRLASLFLLLLLQYLPFESFHLLVKVESF